LKNNLSIREYQDMLNVMKLKIFGEYEVTFKYRKSQQISKIVIDMEEEGSETASKILKALKDQENLATNMMTNKYDDIDRGIIYHTFNCGRIEETAKGKHDYKNNNNSIELTDYIVIVDDSFTTYNIYYKKERVLKFVGDSNFELGDGGIKAYTTNANELILYNTGDVESMLYFKIEKQVHLSSN
jgi:hypothetical protein